MSLTFTKLFSSITESTVWCEPDRTRLAWITLLAMADRHGRVWSSIPGLANRARIPVEDARKAISTFLSPDPDSRTAAQEGRRIEPIDGGWQLINYEKYRATRDDESVLESKRKYINARRAKEREENQPKRASKGNGVDKTAGFDAFWSLYPRHVGRAAAVKAWTSLHPDGALLDRIAAAVSAQAQSEAWRKDGGKFIPHPTTWLNGRRWEDQIFVASAQNTATCICAYCKNTLDLHSTWIMSNTGRMHDACKAKSDAASQKSK